MNFIKLKRKKDTSIKRMHPWVFSGAIYGVSEGISDGEVVTLLDADDYVLAKGFYQEVGSISFRAITFADVDINQSFWDDKIQKAIALRQKLGLLDNPQTTIFRLFHGEGDGIPGLIIDYYDGNLIMQAHTSGVHYVRQEITLALRKSLPSAKCVYYKSDDTLPKYFLENNQVENGYLYKSETVTCPIVALEYGHQFRINWETGQKTGFFIDQRENRKLIEKYSKGKSLLNTFCYSGGFSIYALEHEASKVVSLDSSQKAIDLTNENVALLDGGIQNKHASVVADAVKYIKDLPEDFDIIILDPPAFAKNYKSRHKAVIGYKKINEAAIRQIKSGGIIFTFSCSQVIDKKLFTDTILAAAIEAKREVKILEQLHQPADHPINIFHPESEYLKGLVIEVL